MGETLSKLFIPLDSLPGLYKLPDNCVEPEFNADENLRVTFGGVAQLAFLAFTYGYILFYASNMIADGSELLLLIPKIAPIVGSVVLPILGAVPDGAIILFSGLGNREQAQSQLSIGVGALAGSTIMLLTVPWYLSIYAGRVDIDQTTGHCRYAKPAGMSKDSFTKLSGNLDSMTQTGVQPDNKAMRSGAIIMLVTSIPYFVIQGAAFAYHKDDEALIAKNEQGFALFGLIFCILLFIFYLHRQIKGAATDKVLHDIVDEKRNEALKNGVYNLKAAFFQILSERHSTDSNIGTESQRLIGAGSSSGDDEKERFRLTVKRFFSHYDKDGSGTIDGRELESLLIDLGMPHADNDVKEFMKVCDTDGSGDITLQEFINHIAQLITSDDGKSNSHAPNVSHTGRQSSDVSVVHDMYQHHLRTQASSRGLNQAPTYAATAQSTPSTGDDEEEEEDEEVPEDLAHLPPEVQQQRIIMRSLKMMATGTALVLLFSDPMVEVLDQIGKVIGVPGFYVSFILCPLASNASEFLASYSYALRKTTKTITISLTSLEGAAIMNNTFGLGIFLALVYFRELEWSFSAETISILFVEFCVVFAAWKQVQTLRMGLMVLCLFPISIALVAILENVFGLD